MRTSSLAALPVVLAPQAGLAAAGPDNGGMGCALGGERHFGSHCTLEQRSGGGRLFPVGRQPDGSARYFDVLETAPAPARALADCGEPVRVMPSGHAIEVTIGPDRYRFPAPIAGHGGE